MAAPVRKRPTVFISYLVDSMEEHRCIGVGATKRPRGDGPRARVRALGDELRLLGIDAVIDQYFERDPPPNWKQWTLNKLETCDYTLMICTPVYMSHLGGATGSGGESSAHFQGRSVAQLLARGDYRTRLIPIFFCRSDVERMPAPLRGLLGYIIENFPPSLSRDLDFHRLYERLLGTNTSLPLLLSNPPTGPAEESMAISAAQFSTDLQENGLSFISCPAHGTSVRLVHALFPSFSL